MLNASLYLRKAIRVEWHEQTSGCFVSNRLKRGSCVRAAKWWPETLEAIDALPRKNQRLFFSPVRDTISIAGAQRPFSAMAKKAGLSATASQLRDGAATAAIEAGESENLTNLMLGWSCGIKDHYVRQNPAIVLPAMDATYRNYFGNRRKLGQTLRSENWFFIKSVRATLQSNSSRSLTSGYAGVRSKTPASSFAQA